MPFLPPNQQRQSTEGSETVSTIIMNVDNVKNSKKDEKRPNDSDRPTRPEAQTTSIWPSWCHCHSLSLASVKSRLVFLPFWYRLTWVVPEKGPLNGSVCVCDYCRSHHILKMLSLPCESDIFMRRSEHRKQAQNTQTAMYVWFSHKIVIKMYFVRIIEVTHINIFTLSRPHNPQNDRLYAR